MRHKTMRHAQEALLAQPIVRGRDKYRPTISRTRKPDSLSLEEWQISLRREFGRQQKFRLKNIGGEPIFSEFEVTNPETGGVYRVAIRGRMPGDNYCSCADFAVNTLGTCKHIECALAKLERLKGGKAELKKGIHPPYSEIYLRYGARREVAFRAGTEAPEPLREAASRYFDENGILKPEAYARFEVLLKHAGSAEHEVRCYDDAIGFVAQVRDKARLEKLVGEAFPGGMDDPGLQKLVHARLYPYQCEGALRAARAGRCLIADDMGLGKTVEAIAATEILARVAGVQRVLVICPTSLKHQWRNEIERFAPRSTDVIEGLLAGRSTRYETDSFYKIMNYDVVRRDVERIRAWAPDLIILDEAQRIKNWKTLTAQAVKKLASQYAIVLTGTPLENRLEELHSIVEFVDRFRLGPSFRFLAEHQHVDEVGRVIGYRNLSQISKTLEPILIRRTKDEVLTELPERIDKTFFVPMTEQQMEHHSDNCATVVRIVAKWRRFGFLSETDQRILMIALQNMRMSCNSTYLLDKKTDFGVKADELVSLLGEIFEKPDAKVVVFSQWVRTHELIVNRLQPRKWGFVLFHGGVPGPKRGELIDRFRRDPQCRVFLSTDAGGVGLNLQHAEVVINMDQPWNPAVLEQRIGRVHRLGQHRPVRVVNFVAQGTIEHGMLSLLAFKRSLFSGVLDGGQDEVFLGGTKLKRFMESVEKVTTSIPASEPQDTADKPVPPPGSEHEANDEPVPDKKPAAAEPAGAQQYGGAAAVAGAASAGQDTWTDAISAGMSFFEKLGKALADVQGGGDRKPALPDAARLVARDEKSGQPYLKLPLPNPDTLRKIADLFNALAGGR